MEHAPNQDAILAAFIEPGTLAEVAQRVNMSLAALATWASANAQLLERVHATLLTRCKLIKAHLELSALTALGTVSRATTNTDDPKLRERALERQRKAANAILRHRLHHERASCLAPSPRAAARSVIDEVDDDKGRLSNAQCPMPNSGPSSAALMPRASVPPSVHPPRAPKPSLAERFAQRRLAAMAT